jgi:hypothetical protein
VASNSAKRITRHYDANPNNLAIEFVATIPMTPKRKHSNRVACTRQETRLGSDEKVTVVQNATMGVKRTKQVVKVCWTLERTLGQHNASRRPISAHGEHRGFFILDKLYDRGKCNALSALGDCDHCIPTEPRGKKRVVPPVLRWLNGGSNGDHHFSAATGHQIVNQQISSNGETKHWLRVEGCLSLKEQIKTVQSLASNRRTGTKV